MIVEFTPFSRLLTISLLLVASIALLVACAGGDDDGAGDAAAISVDSPASLSAAMHLTGGTRRAGAIPAAAGSSKPAMSGSRELAVTTNSVSEMQFEVPLPSDSSRVGAVFVQLDGADEHFVIPLGDDGRPLAPSPSRPTRSRIAALGEDVALKIAARRAPCTSSTPPCQTISLSAQPMARGSSVRGPQSYSATLRAAIVTAGDTCCEQQSERNWSGFDDPPSWSAPAPLTVSTTPLGSGELQITLTWDSPADIDLHILEPGGGEISWGRPSSASGGFLDVDDINGFGPENVFYDRAPPAGDYRIEVRHWSGALPVRYTVTVNRGGSVRSYSGSLGTQRQQDHAITISADDSADGEAGVGNGFCIEDYPSAACVSLAQQAALSSANHSDSPSCASLGYGAAQTIFSGDSAGSAVQLGLPGGSCALQSRP